MTLLTELIGEYMADIVVQGTRKEHIQVKINERDILKHAIKILRHQSDLKEGYFLSQDKKEIREDDEWYHGSVTDHLVRKATKKDLETYEVIEALEKAIKKIKD